MNFISKLFLSIRIKTLENQIQMLYSVEHSLWESNQTERLAAVQRLKEKKTSRLAELIGKENDEQ